MRHKEKRLVDLRKDVKNWLPHLGRVMIVNRYGRSFAMVCASVDKVLLLDSHFRSTGYTTPELAYKYSYNIIMWGKGKVDWSLQVEQHEYNTFGYYISFGTPIKKTHIR